MEQAIRLDARHGTVSAFARMIEHMQQCSRNGGLSLTGIFFFVDNQKMYQTAYQTGADEANLEAVLSRARQSVTFGGYGVLFGSFICGVDTVLIQFSDSRAGRISFRCDVATVDTIEVDDSDFDWSKAEEETLGRSVQTEISPQESSTPEHV